MVKQITFQADVLHSNVSLLLYGSVVSATLGNDFRILTSESGVVDDLSISTRDKTWVSIHASDESATVTNGKSWVWPEFVGKGSWLNLVGATESDHLLWVAVVQQEVRPVAGMSFVIISESWFTRGFIRNSISTLDVCGVATSSLWVKSKLVQTSRSGDWSDV